MRFSISTSTSLVTRVLLRSLGMGSISGITTEFLTGYLYSFTPKFNVLSKSSRREWNWDWDHRTNNNSGRESETGMSVSLSGLGYWDGTITSSNRYRSICTRS